jgi:hypothetical protein
MASLATEALYAEQNFDGDKLAAVIHPQRAPKPFPALLIR